LGFGLVARWPDDRDRTSGALASCWNGRPNLRTGKGLPGITSEFRDGLFDATASPQLLTSQTVFFAYSQKESERRWLEVASARLIEDQLENVTVIFSSNVKVAMEQGFGSRLRFDAEGYLLISVGDHAAAANAQDASNALGSIVRIAADGTPAADNPGATLSATDHGGKGGGEVNRITAAANYGWPTRPYASGDAPRAVAQGEFCRADIYLGRNTNGGPVWAGGLLATEENWNDGDDSFHRDPKMRSNLTSAMRRSH